MSAEELALCSSIADFRNSLYPSEKPWDASYVGDVDDKLLMQLFDVRSHSHIPPLVTVLKHGSVLSVSAMAS